MTDIYIYSLTLQLMSSSKMEKNDLFYVTLDVTDNGDCFIILRISKFFAVIHVILL